MHLRGKAARSQTGQETLRSDLMSFIKEAGRSWASARPRPTRPKARPCRKPPPAAALEEEVKKFLGSMSRILKVEVDGDKVKVSGAAPDQATKEKLVVALGNVAGVAMVEEVVVTVEQQRCRGRHLCCQKGRHALGDCQADDGKASNTA